MKIDVLDKKGNKVGELNLKKEVFGIEPNTQVVTQYVRVYLANQRQGNAATKTRGDVSGGGKKPWKQKGTGRARVGSSRNPVWVHGGVSHGPQPRDWSLKFPKKMRKLAFLSVLSDALVNNRITVLENLEMKDVKTKEISGILKALKTSGKTLLVTGNVDRKVSESSRNIKNLKTSWTGILNAYDLLNTKHVIFLKDAIVGIEKKYAGEPVKVKGEKNENK